MKNMIKRYRIWRLKHKAKRIYFAIEAFYDELDCGAHMRDVLNPRGRQLRRKFEKIMDQLRELDPTTPQVRWYD